MSGCPCKRCTKSKSKSKDYGKKQQHYAPHHLSCAAEIDAEVNYRPTVRTKNVHRKGTSFDVIFNIEASPSCHIRQNCAHQKVSACKHKCSLVVDVSCPVVCKPEIRNCGGNPSAKFEVDVDIDTDTTCKARPLCHGKKNTY